jgi:hypothetical protein
MDDAQGRFDASVFEKAADIVLSKDSLCLLLFTCFAVEQAAVALGRPEEAVDYRKRWVEAQRSAHPWWNEQPTPQRQKARATALRQFAAECRKST